MGSQCPQRPNLVLFHKAGIARYVGGENGCQPPLDFVLLWTHWTISAAPEWIVLRVGSGVQRWSRRVKVTAKLRSRTNEAFAAIAIEDAVR